MEQIEIQYTLDKETLKRAYVFSFLTRRQYIIWTVVLFLVISYSATTIGINNGENFWMFFPYLTGIAMSFLFIRYYAPNKWANTLLKTDAFANPQRWVFSENDIHFEMVAGNSDFKWSYLEKVKIGKDVILAYPNKSVVHIIPVSAFTPEQLAQFKTWAKANVKEVIG